MHSAWPEHTAWTPEKTMPYFPELRGSWPDVRSIVHGHAREWWENKDTRVFYADTELCKADTEYWRAKNLGWE